MNKDAHLKISDRVSLTSTPAPRGFIEPHATLLRQPVDGQPLYKVMRAEHLINSIANSYLHFNRVDSYRDFDKADALDGAQLPADRVLNATIGFEKAPTFTAEHYYDQSRARTYACCFALENNAHIWQHYGSGSDHGRVAVVFDFTWLRQHLNAQLMPGTSGLMLNDVPLRQIFSINYGVVDYVDTDQHRLNSQQLPNPILYSYLKAERFRAEHELRVSLSAIGMGRLSLNGKAIELPPSLHMAFDFRTAIAGGGIISIDTGADCDRAWFGKELDKLRIRGT
ncbi:hypothetical protein DBR37_04675 [Herminiimonas sp. KBW02]|uniref:DUF2971 family protein n=1 Tax=Herminiimonas glaciei TaxID=523788 RepID=A0ABW2I659_9BURK|nr:hypothetical protein [Herminiimonas sp. KBW02]RQO35676.1 hypothetical protein DBR37_04675 [Herminiimonas sp. KBW02]